MNTWQKTGLLALLVALVVCTPLTATAEEQLLPSDQEAVGAPLAPTAPLPAAAPAAAPGVTPDEVPADPSVSPAVPGGKPVAAFCGGGFFSRIFQFLGNLFQRIVQFLSGICGGGGCGGGGWTGGGDRGGGGWSGGGDDGDDGGSYGVEPPDPPSGGTGITGNIPSDKATLVAEIRSKFGVSMRDGSGSWSVASLQATYKALSVLPPSFRKWNRTMTMEGYRGGLLGLGEVGGGNLWIYSGATRGSSGIRTIIHEMTHNYQGNSRVTQAWRSQFWGRNRTSSPTDYGNTNYLEDMAESVSLYYTNGAWLKRRDPARYEFVKTNIMEGKEF